jgi:hypothetical protein
MRRYDRSVAAHHQAIDGINIANGLPDMRSVAQVKHLSLMSPRALPR